jgi:hypothetical protein
MGQKYRQDKPSAILKNCILAKIVWCLIAVFLQFIQLAVGHSASNAVK